VTVRREVLEEFAADVGGFHAGEAYLRNFRLSTREGDERIKVREKLLTGF
jgi:hypothetical protein